MGKEATEGGRPDVARAVFPRTHHVLTSDQKYCSSESAHRRFPQACRGPIPSPRYLQEARRHSRGSATLEHGRRSSGAILCARSKGRSEKLAEPLPALRPRSAARGCSAGRLGRLVALLAVRCSIVHGAVYVQEVYIYHAATAPRSIAHRKLPLGRCPARTHRFLPSVNMTTASSSQPASWDAFDVLNMIDPAVGELRCVGDATSRHRRCQTSLSQPDICEATRILAALPSIADDNSALLRQLARLASRTLCKRLHRKSHTRHSEVIARWTKDIEQARALHRSSLPSSGDQSTIQRTRQQQSNPILHSSGSSRQAVPAASDSCTICLDHVGSNGGCKTLSCRHAFCRGCIDRWFNESRSCPVCRDYGSERRADPASPSLYPAERQPDAEHVEEHSHRNSTFRTNGSLSPAIELPEYAREPRVEPQQATIREPRAVRETSAGLHVSGRNTNAVPVAETPLGPQIEQDCGICLEAVGQNGIPETLQCSHTFCSCCISEWLYRSPRCPYRCELGRHSHADDDRRE